MVHFQGTEYRAHTVRLSVFALALVSGGGASAQGDW
jgi:hypothetical protein